ncbi:MAG: cobalt-precorrin-5B (C(1))-methyltransferase [Desulfobacterales bacterium]|nr:MAG: cobalt-precorrin-5B (C(1))-methyltransferase [Desulfobacterales bacterium]
MTRRLRTGFTTGTAAAAAAKGALLLLVERKIPTQVQVELLTGDRIVIPVHACAREGEHQASCRIIKDAGDDPDVTHKAQIGARVTLAEQTEHPQRGYSGESVNRAPVWITGGKGVGRVTKPGLEIPPGEPAINPGPRKMITRAVREVLAQHRLQSPVKVEVFVPQGEVLATKTLNARLGILGGISILGTTGIVRPMSHEAYFAAIEASLAVARASGLAKVVFTTGRRSERYAQLQWPRLPEAAFVQIGDFFKASLQAAGQKGFEEIILAVFFGKAIKMAQGVPHTHAAKSSLSLAALAKWTLEATLDREVADTVQAAHTAREALHFIAEICPEVIGHVGRRIVSAARSYAGAPRHIQSVIFNYEGEIIFDSGGSHSP